MLSSPKKLFIATILPMSILAFTSLGSNRTTTRLSITSSSTIASFTTDTGTFEQPNFSTEQLYALNKRFWDSFVFPANLKQMKSVNSTLFAQNVIGRVDASRTFHGRELNTEYVFGSFGNIGLNPSAFTLLGIPLFQQPVHFSANQNIVSVAEIIFFNLTLINRVVPVEVDAWIAFNADGEISEYDISFRWFAWVIDNLIGSIAQHLGPNVTTANAITVLTSRLATQICQTSSTFCIGKLAQYDDIAKCQEFLTSKVRFGNAYEFGMDTLLCRSLHGLMVPLRPDVHCAHIGPTGGNMCIDDFTYAQKVLQPLFTNVPFIPYDLQSSNITVAAMKYKDRI